MSELKEILTGYLQSMDNQAHANYQQIKAGVIALINEPEKPLLIQAIHEPEFEGSALSDAIDSLMAHTWCSLPRCDIYLKQLLAAHKQLQAYPISSFYYPQQKPQDVQQDRSLSATQRKELESRKQTCLEKAKVVAQAISPM